jgi:hypothetical protein
MPSTSNLNNGGQLINISLDAGENLEIQFQQYE